MRWRQSLLPLVAAKRLGFLPLVLDDALTRAIGGCRLAQPKRRNRSGPLLPRLPKVICHRVDDRGPFGELLTICGLAPGGSRYVAGG